VTHAATANVAMKVYELEHCFATEALHVATFCVACSLMLLSYGHNVCA